PTPGPGRPPPRAPAGREPAVPTRLSAVMTKNPRPATITAAAAITAVRPAAPPTGRGAAVNPVPIEGPSRSNRSPPLGAAVGQPIAEEPRPILRPGDPTGKRRSPPQRPAPVPARPARGSLMRREVWCPPRTTGTSRYS